MNSEFNRDELNDRLSLIERMIAEGRREIESWGWAFILWGIAYYSTIAFSTWTHSPWAWPAPVLIALVSTVLIARMKGSEHPQTTINRAVGSIWIALAISMFLLFVFLGVSGRITDPHSFMAVMSAILGMANGASALMLRWKMQFACAVVWWITTAAVCFGSNAQSTLVFLVAIFFCQILFGIYGIVADAQMRKRRDPVHA